MEVSLEEKKYIKENSNNIIDLNGKSYYVKRVIPTSLFTEVIAEEICKILDIKCAHYEIVEIDNDYYYLSEMLGLDGFFKHGKELKGYYDLKDFDIYSQDSLYWIWNCLEQEGFSNVSVLVNELVKIYIFDMTFFNADRNSCNWAIVNDGKENHIYAFDNEFIFEDFGHVLTSKLSYGDELVNPYSWEELEDNFQYRFALQELEYFLNESSFEYIEFFNWMLNKLTPEVLEDIIDRVGVSKVNCSLKNTWLKAYKIHYENMKLLLENRGKNGKGIHKN